MATLSPTTTTTRERRLSSASAIAGAMTNVINTDGYERDEVFTASGNEFQQSWFNFITTKGTVLNNILVPGFLFTVWGATWTVIYMLTSFRVLFPNSQALISIISFVVALILGYRTNSAYDRYWEARKVWGTLVTHSRNLARAFWCSTSASTPQQEIERLGAINLIMAYSVALKHSLRDEQGFHFTDLAHLLVHVPKFRPGARNPPKENIPMEIILLLTEYVRNAEEAKILEATPKSVMNGCIGGMIECMTNFERIRNTPIPLAYAIHLKHILVLFLLALPFQISQVLSWLAIPVMFIASFTLLGIESISAEIEQPFGYDVNDLRLNEFCNDLRMELNALTHSSKSDRDVLSWNLDAVRDKNKNV
ncbi:Bestrophin, RFP-TM, chloride channel-domain-containing protein [Chytriomyces cf. hyalinus JEL632]|nr:Bestrophin, RFP-TM, chloride channel-domain-containing protein [Chytriomyces cf. hyalinus JEL632]